MRQNLQEETNLMGGFVQGGLLRGVIFELNLKDESELAKQEVKERVPSGGTRMCKSPETVGILASWKN